MTKVPTRPDITILTSMSATTVEELIELSPEIERMARDAAVNTNDLMQRLEKSIDSSQHTKKLLKSLTPAL